MRKLLAQSSWHLKAVILLTIVGAVLRLWNYVPGLMFQGDQARDALIVSNIFLKHDPVFIGPVTSVGNMYLGPLYYYFMLPWLMLSYPSPLGPALAVTFLSIISIPLMYFMGKEIVGKTAAVISATFLTLSSIVITFSRFSWNPNPAPIVMLFTVWAAYRAMVVKPRYWLLAAIGFSILIQLHYVALLAGGGLILVWLLQVGMAWRNGTLRSISRELILATVGSVLIFCLSLTPLILFDYKHDGLNRKALVAIFTTEKIVNDPSSISLVAKISSLVRESDGRAATIGYNHFFGKNVPLARLCVISFLLATVLSLRHAATPHKKGILVLVCCLLTTIVGTALYQHTIFDHYLLYIFPVVFWFWGYWLAALTPKRWGVIVTVVTLLCFAVYNLPRIPFKIADWTILDVKSTAHEIATHLQPSEQYSLVLLGPSKDLYAQNYRYFLSTTDRPPLPPERAAEAQTLVVIDEEKTQDVASVPIYEIVIFPNKQHPETFMIPKGPRISIFRR